MKNTNGTARKHYESPSLEVTELAYIDILSASGAGGGLNPIPDGDGDEVEW